jgi:hypothetical protein
MLALEALKKSENAKQKPLTHPFQSGKVAPHTEIQITQMRTKTLLLTAALGGAMTTAAMAQAVYSQNIVGYVNVTVPANSFALIANQLDSGNNTLGSLIPTAPDGTQFYKFTGSGWLSYAYDELENGWLPDGNVTLAPGEGGFLRNNDASPITVTFVGEVMQGTLAVTLPAGYAVRSSVIPVAGNAVELEIPALDGDQIFKYTPGAGYTSYAFDELENGWLPSNPNFAVGEAFFIRKGASAQWVRQFSIN